MSAVDVRRGIAWTGVAHGVMGIIDVASTLLLLRYWLTPADYGIAAIATTLYPMLDLLGDAGMTSAIVQRDDADDATLSTAYWVTLASATIVGGALLAIGPLLAAVHGHAVIAGLFVLYGAKLAAQTLHVVPIAMLRRELRFRELTAVRLAGAVAEVGGKLGGAALGLGVWCFAVGHLAKTVGLIVAAQVARPFRPRWRFSRTRARGLLRFGTRHMGSQVLFHAYTNVDYQIVSYAFGAAATGLYRAAYELVLEPAKILSYVVVEVAFPVFSRLRGDVAALRAQLGAFTRQNMIVLAPMVGLMLLVPGELLALAYGESWSTAADAVRILCAVAALRALSYMLPPLLDGLGRAELTLRYTAVAAVAVPSIQVLAALVLGPSLGWMSVAVGWAIGYPFAFAALAYLALAQIAMPLSRWVAAAAAPAFAGALALGAGALVLTALPASAVARVAVVGTTIAAVHAGMLAILSRRRARATS